MSSMIFQPLLHDPLGWKSEKSTYNEHFKWRKVRSRSKTKKNSTGKIANLVEKIDEKTIEIRAKSSIETKVENVRAKTATVRSSSAKTSGETTKRPISANENFSTSREEIANLVEEKKINVESNSENFRHWLTYPNPPTPQYLIEIKQRLGQMKKSSLNPTNAQNLSSNCSARPNSGSSQREKSNNEEQHRFFDFERRQTPDGVRAARLRFDKHRYNPSLDNFPPRPQTAPIFDQTKTVETEQTEQTNPTVKIDAWSNENPNENEKENQEENPEENLAPFRVEIFRSEQIPAEYVRAVETASIAQQQFQRTIQTPKISQRETQKTPSVETKTENVSLVPPTIENQIDSSMAFHQQIPTTVPNPNFSSWIRNSTEKERASAMKILQEVLNQPIVGYDPPNKKKSHLKEAPAPPPLRVSSATRKLGRTRTQHRFPCEICEKILIKRHVWDLSRPETNICPHQPERISVRS